MFSDIKLYHLYFDTIAEVLSFVNNELHRALQDDIISIQFSEGRWRLWYTQ